MSKENSNRSKREPYLLRKRKNNRQSSCVAQQSNTHPDIRISEGDTSGNQTAEAFSTNPTVSSHTVTTPVCTEDTLYQFTSEKTKMAPPTLDSTPVSHSDFTKTTERIIEKLDTLNSNVSAIRREVSEIRADMADLQAAVKETRERLTVIENDILPKMQKKNESVENELKQMIMALEHHDRKMNLLIYGVEKKKDEQVVEVVRKIIHELGFSKEEALSMVISNAHRLPRRITPGSDESRRGHDPIIVRFTTMLDRDAVLGAYQRAQRPVTSSQGQRAIRHAFHVVTDLPAPMKRRRFLLEQKAYQLRKNENKSTRIRLNGVNLHLECRERGSSSAWRIVLG